MRPIWFEATTDTEEEAKAAWDTHQAMAAEALAAAAKGLPAQ